MGIFDKMNKDDEDSKCVEGVDCEVTNCVYHHPGLKCKAGKIKVGPTFASECSETICSTFKPNSQNQGGNQ